jgi:hypothetical protein
MALEEQKDQRYRGQQDDGGRAPQAAPVRHGEGGHDQRRQHELARRQAQHRNADRAPPFGLEIAAHGGSRGVAGETLAEQPQPEQRSRQCAHAPYRAHQQAHPGEPGHHGGREDRQRRPVDQAAGPHQRGRAGQRRGRVERAECAVREAERGAELTAEQRDIEGLPGAGAEIHEEAEADQPAMGAQEGKRKHLPVLRRPGQDGKANSMSRRRRSVRSGESAVHIVVVGLRTTTSCIRECDDSECIRRYLFFIN